MRYFVFYQWLNREGTSGCGRCEMVRNRPITCIADIESMEAQILNVSTNLPCGSSIMIANWQLFEEEQET